MTREIRIAHLSDLHLPLGAPAGAEWLGKRGLSGLSWLIRRNKMHRAEIAEALLADLTSTPHDVVAMTGDLINFGLEREFAASRAWLDRMGPPERVIAIPGNHEALAGNWRAAMDRHWGPYHQSGGVFAHGVFSIIAVSSAVTTPPLMASGHVDPPGVQLLARQLAEARAAGQIPIVLIHHPPTPISIRRKSLSNGTEVSRVLAQGGACLVLHGHTHKRELSWIEAPHGRIPVLGIPSFSMHPDHHSCAGAWRMVRAFHDANTVKIEVSERCMAAGSGIRSRTPIVMTLPALAPA